MTDPEKRTVRSFCRICTAICGILVDVEGDQVLKVRGDKENPLSHGYTCPKGRALPQMHHHPDRIEYPMMRVDGELQRRPWQDCLDDIGDKLRRIVEEHGPQSVGIYFGSGLGMDAAGYKMEEALLGAIGTPAKFSPLTIDGTAKTLATQLVAGFPGFMPHVDYPRSKMVMYIGVNPVVSHGHANGLSDPVSALRTLKTHAEIWVLDPRLTETARMATKHLAPRPATDYAVLAFLARELLRDGADPEMLEHQTQGREALAEAVEPFTTASASHISGVSESDLEELILAVRRNGPVGINWGTGVTMTAAAGNVTSWLAWVIMALTGALNRPGGMWFHPGFNFQLDGFEFPVLPPDALFGPGPRSHPEAQSFMGEWPCAVLPDEIRAGNIKAFLNLGGSLLTSFPDYNVLKPELQSLEVLVTTEIVANETTGISTHVLPTKGQLERIDVNLWDILEPKVSSVYTQAVVEPVGDRRSAWWVLAEIGRRLGHDLADLGASDRDMLVRAMAGARCSFDELENSGYVEFPVELPAAWVDSYLERSGGWQLAPQLMVDELARLEPPPALVLIPRRQVRKLNVSLDFLGESAEVLIHPDDALEAGVVDGQPVVVRSKNGQLTGTAKVDKAIRRGVISVPHGHHDANVNALSDKDEFDLITGMVRYSAIPVIVEPADVSTRRT